MPRTEKFDLEKALAGAKVVTRDGREVKGLMDMRAFGVEATEALVGVIGKHIFGFWIDGKATLTGTETSRDLFLAASEPKRRKWLKHVDSVWYNRVTPISPGREAFLSCVDFADEFNDAWELLFVEERQENGRWIVIGTRELEAEKAGE